MGLSADSRRTGKARPAGFVHGDPDTAAELGLGRPPSRGEDLTGVPSPAGGDHVLLFIELGSRRVHLGGGTANPDAAWVTQQARNFAVTMPEDIPSRLTPPTTRP